MAKKYSVEVIRQYVNGSDIEGYEIEELENDPIFMRCVIFHTNDKKIYQLCSDQVKKDSSFVKYMIKKFPDDLKFLDNVVEEYLNKNQNELNKVEIMLQMRELSQKQDFCDDLYLKYSLLLKNIYIQKEFHIEVFKQQKEKSGQKEVADAIGMGFCIIQDDFGSSDVALKYFAESFLTELFFGENKEDLEKILHQRFDSIEKLQKFGMNRFLIDLIREYDFDLSFFTSDHLELLENIKIKVGDIANRWEQYNKEKETRRYDVLYKSVEAYVEANKDIIYTPQDFIYFIGEKLGIAESIKRYEQENWLDDGLYDEIMSSTMINKDSMDMRELEHYYNIRRLMQGVLKQEEVDETVDYYPLDFERKRKGKCKVKL